ncbi:hypothetical protein OHS70_17780 [Streptomyces sp. NBC_00390]|uniref:hypothetical protein n=1 Tax=Streptomyces sp. NBC_00390 TaxID=2975736 RepID=UPI002E1D9A61
MALLDQPTVTTHHRGPSRRTLALVLLTAGTLLLSGTWYLVQQYSERPPWAEDIAYEAGFVQGTRIRKTDPTGGQVEDLLAGGCARMVSKGLGGVKATYDPALWVTGCLDGASARPPARQGLFH